MSINTDPKQIDEVLSRSIANILPSTEGLRDKLLSGNKLRFYIGADATGPELHLGHATNFLLLERFRELGHEIVLLFGDFTAMVGDPSGKNSTRKQLTEEDVEKNIKTWKEQVAPILTIEGKDNPVIIRKNSEWLKEVDFKKVIELASNFTVQHMIERDMFEKRMKENKPVYVHEFLYPLMVGYDSVVLDVDVEVGGVDQTFNMLAGRTLQNRYTNKDKYIIATTLLEDPQTGKKLMSKSEGNYIALNDSPNDMFGKTMSLTDEVVESLFIDCTRVPLDEVKEIIGLHPKEAKLRLAYEIVKLYHGEQSATNAQKNFDNAFSKGEVPEDVLAVEVHENTPLVDTLVTHGVVSSKSDFRRLITGNAITHMESGEKITDDKVGSKSGTYKVGKHRFIKIK